MTQIQFQPYTKALLAQILGIHKNTLANYLRRKKSKLLTIDPLYRDTDKRLHPDIFLFICKEHGVSKDEIARRFQLLFPNHEQVNIEKIKGIYGLND